MKKTGLFLKIKRAKEIMVKAKNIQGDDLEIKVGGLSARTFQHEIDHLDGKLFIDRLSPIKSARIKAKIKKFGYEVHPVSEADTEDELEKAETNRL